MLTTTTPLAREAGARRATASAASPMEHAAFDPAAWQRILTTVRTQHPTLNRVWFDQLVPRQLTPGVIQVTVQTAANYVLFKMRQWTRDNLGRQQEPTIQYEGMGEIVLADFRNAVA